ncbi:MAG: hypothetical protein KF801_03255 [Cryobacterium sp.]|nr:hypothetical protein [Cryobacterium sp.]
MNSNSGASLDGGTHGGTHGAVGAADASTRPIRSASWVPWVLFVAEFVIAAVVVGILSVILVVQLTLTPGAILGEFDGIFTWVVSLGFTAAVELVGAVILFAATGLAVGILGMPIRLIGPLRRLWLGNGEVTILGVAIGVLFIVAAYIFGSWGSVDGQFNTYTYYSPSPWPLLVGWLLLAFSLSMLVWPARWMPRRARAWWTETQLTKHPKPGA